MKENIILGKGEIHRKEGLIVYSMYASLSYLILISIHVHAHTHPHTHTHTHTNM
jgi:hypothetical protein